MPLLRGPDGPLEDDPSDDPKDTAIWQELKELELSFEKWLLRNDSEFWCPEHKEQATKIHESILKLVEDMSRDKL